MPQGNLSWALIGDFNEVVDAFEKCEGAPFDPNRGRIFSYWIRNMGLLDVPADDPKFTWIGPKIGNYDRVMERLNRLLCNESWRVSFEEATVSVLPKICSDHPLLLRLEKSPP